MSGSPEEDWTAAVEKVRAIVERQADSRHTKHLIIHDGRPVPGPIGGFMFTGIIGGHVCRVHAVDEADKPRARARLLAMLRGEP